MSVSPHPSVLVIGGGSRIAGALHDSFSGNIRWVSRRPTGRSAERCVADYAAIPSDVFQGINCVVNCVGISKGTRAELDHVNHDLPAKFAADARAAGVRRFIHISSFSVYGCAASITRETEPAPVSDYGRSKLAADRTLGAMVDQTFGVIILRLPLIYGRNSMGKLDQLLRLWHRTRIMPIPRGDVARSMIGVDLTARVLSRLIVEGFDEQIAFAADPRPFTYTDAARARPGDDLWLLPVPLALTRLVVRSLPGWGTRLFTDSHLADRDNLAVEYNLGSDLYDDIAAADLTGSFVRRI